MSVRIHAWHPRQATAKVAPTNKFDGTFTWTYGDLTLTGNPVSLPRSDGWKTNHPPLRERHVQGGGGLPHHQLPRTCPRHSSHHVEPL